MISRKTKNIHISPIYVDKPKFLDRFKEPKPPSIRNHIITDWVGIPPLEYTYPLPPPSPPSPPSPSPPSPVLHDNDIYDFIDLTEDEFEYLHDGMMLNIDIDEEEEEEVVKRKKEEEEKMKEGEKEIDDGEGACFNDCMFIMD